MNSMIDIILDYQHVYNSNLLNYRENFTFDPEYKKKSNINV